MAKDFLIDTEGDGDILIQNGDFAIGDSTLQHQEALLASTPGEYRQYPEIGVGLVDYLNDETSMAGLRAKIISEFENDGMLVVDVNIELVNDDPTIQPKATYRNG